MQIDLVISVKLAKKTLTDYEDTNFVELMRVNTGEVKKLQDTSTYSELKKYFAKRTYDESGDYSVEHSVLIFKNLLTMRLVMMVYIQKID